MKGRRKLKIRMLSFSIAFALCFTTVFSLSVLTGYEMLVFAKKTVSETVTNQKELNKALRDAAVNNITIKSDEKELKIKKGSYGGVKLTINAAKANIINQGSDFDQITIKNASSFTENGDNNNIVSKDSKIKIVVKKASDNLKLIIAQKNSEVKITAAGNVSDISITKPGNKTTLAVKGSVQTANIKSASTLIMTGDNKSENAVAVNMTANRAVLQSSVLTEVSVFAKVEVVFKKGSAGSSVTTLKDGAAADVTNKSGGKIELIGKIGSKIMEDGEKGKVEDAVTSEAVSDNKIPTVTGNTVTGNTVTPNTVTGNTTGGGGGGGGASSSSSSSSGSGTKPSKPDPVVSGDSVSGDSVSPNSVSPNNVSPNSVTPNSVTSNTILSSGSIYEKNYIVMGDYNKASSLYTSEPLEWEVLGEDENGILVLSRKVFADSSFDGLNHRMELIISNGTFTDEEMSKIKKVTRGGEERTLFCLSRAEIDKYFGNSLKYTQGYNRTQKLMAEPSEYFDLYYSSARKTITEYAYYTGLSNYNNNDDYDLGVSLKDSFYTEDCIGKKYAKWWLEDTDGDYVCWVDYYGTLVSDLKSDYGSANYGVRPAMYLDKNATYTWKTEIVEPSYVKFGYYSQEKVSEGYATQEIEWEILDENENGTLLLSKNILDCWEYNSFDPELPEYEYTVYGSTAANSWLNGHVIDEAFKDDSLSTKKNQIQEVTIDGATCKAFFLSVDEVKKYFGVNYTDEENKMLAGENLICKATDYALNAAKNAPTGTNYMTAQVIEEAVYNSKYKEMGYSENSCDIPGCQWFLRTAVDNKNICIVDNHGVIFYGTGVNVGEWYGYRPAIYVKGMIPG